MWDVSLVEDTLTIVNSRLYGTLNTTIEYTILYSTSKTFRFKNTYIFNEKRLSFLETFVEIIGALD